MSYHHNSAVCGLCYFCQSAEDRAHLIGSVHIYIGSKERLQWVNDNQSGIVFSDRIFDTFISQSQRIICIVNHKHSFQIRFGRK